MERIRQSELLEQLELADAVLGAVHDELQPLNRVPGNTATIVGARHRVAPLNVRQILDISYGG